MPLYDYKCSAHGMFNELATVADAALPAPCPACHTPAVRVIAVPKAILGLQPALMQALALNERNSHEPALRSESERHSKCGHDQGRLGSKLFYTKDGNKMFPSMRPWMISH